MFINEDGDVETRAGCLASQDTQVDQCNVSEEPKVQTALLVAPAQRRVFSIDKNMVVQLR